LTYIDISPDGPILSIRINRPEKKNALTGAMYDAIAAGFDQASQSADIRVVLLSAVGDIFSAGNDIGEFAAMRGDFADSPQSRFFQALTQCGKPIVASVNGPAIGVGMTMLLHCDFVYVAPSAMFSTPFVDMALVPEGGSSWLMPARFGYPRAAAMLLLGEPLSGQQALQLGLVNEIVTEGPVDARARKIALRLADKPPAAIARARALMRPDGAALYAHMQTEMAAFAKALRSGEAAEALAAFLEKRKPDFSKLPS